MAELVETLCFRLVIHSGERERLGHARFDAQPIANYTLALRRLGYSKTDICDKVTDELDATNHVKNNAQQIARKACDAYDSYERAHKKWRNSDEQDELPEPQPPSTNRKGAFPLVMAPGEGYNVSIHDDGRIGFRVSPQPYKKVEGVLRGRDRDLNRVRDALGDDSEWSLGRGELLYRDGVYYLHVTVKRDQPLADPEDSETIISVDVNERNITITAIDRHSRDIHANIVVDYGQVKHQRQRCYDIKRRCQEHEKPSVVASIGDYVENYTEWTLHRISKIIEHYVAWFPAPVVVFESLEGIRSDMDYGSYMNRRLHRLPFYEFERQVTYKTQRHGAPVIHVSSRDNSKRCACCGEVGSRRDRRFQCSNDACALVQDHADRNATMNTAVKGIAKLEDGADDHAAADNYRPHKTPPAVRVRRVGSGRVNRPTPSHALADVGVLST